MGDVCPSTRPVVLQYFDLCQVKKYHAFKKKKIYIYIYIFLLERCGLDGCTKRDPADSWRFSSSCFLDKKKKATVNYIFRPSRKRERFPVSSFVFNLSFPLPFSLVFDWGFLALPIAFFCLFSRFVTLCLSRLVGQCLGHEEWELSIS